jgi:iron-sulfur cluster repair protein YtfE (RIC family)
VAAAGTGTAAYLFGVAVVMPVLAPAAPFVGGAVLLAGAFKWFTDGGKRKRSEIRDKRRAFEDELRARLKVAEQSYLAQLDQVAQGFHESARQMLTPLLLEAEAAGRVQGMRERIAGKVIAQSQAAIEQLENHLRQQA